MSYFKRKGFNKRSIIDSAVGHSTGHRIQKPRTAAIMKRNPGFWRISSVEASSISKTWLRATSVETVLTARRAQPLRLSFSFAPIRSVACKEMIFLNIPKVGPSGTCPIRISQQQQRQSDTEPKREQSYVKRKSRSSRLRNSKFVRAIFHSLHVSI